MTSAHGAPSWGENSGPVQGVPTTAAELFQPRPDPISPQPVIEPQVIE